MQNIISGPLGLVHILSAVFSMILGLMVMITRKGTRRHRKLGYSYAFSMLVLNVTALMIYRLFGRFGPFHVASIISLLTLMMGTLPAILRKPKSSWLWYHMAGMYYSIVGLYAAFVSEVVTRIPGLPFFSVIGISTALIMAVAMWWFRKKSSVWFVEYSSVK